MLQNVGWLLETADLLYRSTVDTERSFLLNTQSKSEEDNNYHDKFLTFQPAFCFVNLFKTAIFVTCLG